MARNTGPGKVSDNLDKTPRTALTGLLFNFDVEGDAVKPEHQEWLRANVLPLLACDQAVGSLKGMASRSGSAAYNLQLSEKRVRNVKQVLAAQGASPAKLNALWVGEEAAALAGVADGTEEERDRAVAISVQLPPRRGVLHFVREDPADLEDGFDSGVTPEWLMLPTFERRQLVLRNGAGLRLVATNPSKVQFADPVSLRTVNDLVVTSNRQVVQFVGNLPGDAAVEGHDLATGRVRRLLDVEVMQPRRVKLAFHFVSDPEHPTPRRPVPSVADMLRDARRVYKRQANVLLEAVSETPDTIRFARSLGDATVPPFRGQQPITLATVGGTLYPVLEDRRTGAARINVYYVWEFQSGTAGDVNGRADAIPGKAVIFEDDTGSPEGTHEGYTLAHEIGHCLGLPHVPDTSNLADKVRLMWDFTNQHLGKLTRNEVRIVRANVR